jgi:hypothetical protein
LAGRKAREGEQLVASFLRAVGDGAIRRMTAPGSTAANCCHPIQPVTTSPTLKSGCRDSTTSLTTTERMAEPISTGVE